MTTQERDPAAARLGMTRKPVTAKTPPPIDAEERGVAPLLVVGMDADLPAFVDEFNRAIVLLLLVGGWE